MKWTDMAALAAIAFAALCVAAAATLRPAAADGAGRVEFADEPMEAAFEPPKPETLEEEHAENAPSGAEAVPGASFDGLTEEYAAAVEATPYIASEPSLGVYVAEYDDAYGEHGPTRDMPGWHDGYLETWYNASSHYLASTWTLDDEGFYRDAEGRYVVGVEIGHADEMPYGTVVMTGRGEGVVYDYGSGAEVHDFATAW